MVDLAMDPDVAAPLIERFDTLSDRLSGLRGTLVSQATAINDACGEFQDSVVDGSDAFQMSWRESFDICGTTAGLIAGNTNVFDIELQRLDADLSEIPDLSGGPT